MIPLFTDDCIYNILGHIKTCWNYDYPTGKTLETAFYRGIQPFHPDARQLGSPLTITDAGTGTQAFDIKGSKVLGHLKKLTKNSNQDNNVFVTQEFGDQSVIVRVPTTAITQVRRPKMGLTGDPEKTINKQVQDYVNFAFTTMKDDGYSDLYSVVLLYGQDKGWKSVFLTLTQFSVPGATRYEVAKRKNGKPGSYFAYDANNNVVYSIIRFNSGSSNFSKRFNTEEGVLMTWPEDAVDNTIYTKERLNEQTAIKIIKK